MVTILLYKQILVTAEPTQKDYKFISLVQHLSDNFHKTNQTK